MVSPSCHGAASSGPESLQVRRDVRWLCHGHPQDSPIPEEHSESIAWIRRASLPLSDLTEPAVMRRALGALMVTLDGRPAAKATIVRKRATLNNALEYAVELGIFDANPLRRIKMRLPKSEVAVDRRVVVNPEQARDLLREVRDVDPALEGFFAFLYFAGLRPAEARHVRIDDCELPTTGWGTVVLTGSQQYSGAAWTDTGEPDERRQLKHRSLSDIRRIPLHPDLVDTLHRHIAEFPLGVGGRLFVTRTRRAGAPLAPPYQNAISMGIVYSAWHRARAAAFTPTQVASPMARRPYDLRHACLSTWLNAGVPPAQVAVWAGHGVDVLLRVYANCLDGQEEAARVRIEAAVGSHREP